ncbi:MAG: hypothetical protein KDA89_06205, partial [Planctomycetaceae bacterium]|nr:hypothetical protein [Planctomycetaceae bacterium]
RHHVSVSEATLRVSEALGAGDYNFTIARPVYEIIAGDVAAKLVYVNQVQISSLAIAAGRMAKGIEGDGFQDHALRAFDALADQVASAGDVAAWANQNTIGYMLRDVNSYATAPLPNETIQQLTDLLAARMSDLNDLLETSFASEIEFLESLTRMKKVLHGELANAIRDLSAGSKTFSEIETLYGDAAFSTLAETQSIGVIIPPAIGIGNAIVSEGHGGTTVLRFEVGVVGNHGGPISVDYQSFDGTARAASGDYVPVSGTLTWSAGDTDSQFIEIQVNGDPEFESDETVRLLLSNPTNAVVRIDAGIGFIVNDDGISVDASTTQPGNHYVVVHSSDRLSTVHQQQLRIDGNFFASTRLNIAGDQDVPNDFVVDFGSSTFRDDNYSFSGGTNNDQLTAIGGTFQQIMVGGVLGSQPQIRLIGQDGTPVEMTFSDVELIHSDVSQLDRVQLRLDNSTSVATLSDADSQETGQMKLQADGATLPEWIFANPSLIEIVSFHPALTVTQLSQDSEFSGSVTVRQAGASLSSEAISSTAAIDSVLGDFTSEDPLFADGLTVSLLSSPTDSGNSIFRIEGTNLILSAPLDSLAGSNASIVVSISNGFGDTLEQTFILSIESPSDTTAPTASIVPLPLSWASSTINLDIILDDPAGNGGEPISGVATYDLYVAIGDGGWTLFADDVPASQTQISVSAESNKRYWFRAVATDVAGNAEIDAGIPEANTYTLDFEAPESTVTDVTVNDSTGLMAIHVEGIDHGGSQVAGFDIYVSIDGGVPALIVGSPVPAIHLGDGTIIADLNYQGLMDGESHTYRFFSRGRDSRGNLEGAPANLNDFQLTRTFVTAASLEATNIIIQNGETQRSYIRNIDILFNDASGLQDLILNNRLRLERFAADTTDTSAGSGTIMSGLNATANGNAISLDFGSDGIGGLRDAGDGYYRLSLDLDGDGIFDDALFEFFRLFGDSDGDGIVSGNDYRTVQEDINGDGRIDSRDRRDARLFRGNRIAAVHE